MAYQTRIKKLSHYFLFWITVCVVIEGVIVSLQYLEVAFTFSDHWDIRVTPIFDYLKYLNYDINGVKYLISVLIIILLNLPILFVTLLLILFQFIKIRAESEKSILFLGSLLLPFLMTFGILSIPIMKLLLSTYDGITNEKGTRVLRRYTALECESQEQICLFIAACMTIILQIISSLIFISFMYKEGIFDKFGNIIHSKENPDQIELNEGELQVHKEENSNYLVNYLCKRKRFKVDMDYLPVVQYLFQLSIVGSTIFLPQNDWIIPLGCSVVILLVGVYFIKIHPYSDSRYNHYFIALLFHVFVSFFRIFILNLMPNNTTVVQIASLSIFAGPVFLLCGLGVSYIRSIQLNYNENDYYDQIETESASKNESNNKYANIIIQKIRKLKMKGVKIQEIRIKESEIDWVLAHGIFWVDNEIGLKNICILLAHLSELPDDKGMYFSKIAIK